MNNKNLIPMTMNRLLLTLFLVAQLFVPLSFADKLPFADNARVVLIPVQVNDEDKEFQDRFRAAIREGLSNRYEVINALYVDETSASEYQTELVAESITGKIENGYMLTVVIRNFVTNQTIETLMKPCYGCEDIWLTDQLRFLAADNQSPVTTSSQADVTANLQTFKKIGANGDILTEDTPNWDCVLDSNSGLLWEIKTDNGGLRDKDNTYSWNDSFLYAGNVNVKKLCGQNNWRMPSKDELFSLVIKGNTPAIDATFFPDTFSSDTSASYWCSDLYGGSKDGAWFVDFGTGLVNYSGKKNRFSVRVVSKATQQRAGELSENAQR